VENLISNALQAVMDDTGQIEVSAVEDPPWLIVTVDDNGPGVDPEIVDHIFEADVTGRTDGTGLGLTFVKGVVEAHGGRIEYHPSMMGGARFVASLPLTNKERSIDGVKA